MRHSVGTCTTRAQRLQPAEVISIVWLPRCSDERRLPAEPYLRPAEERRRDGKGDWHYVERVARRVARGGGTRVALVDDVRSGGDAEAEDEIAPPQRLRPEVDQVGEVEAACVGGAERDADDGAHNGERDAEEHAARDRLVIDELVEGDVDDELHGLYRHEDGSGGERKGCKVQKRAGDED